MLVKLLRDLVSLVAVGQTHSLDSFAVRHLRQGGEFLLQLPLPFQQLLDRLVFTVDRNICHGENRFPVHYGLSVLQLYLPANQRVPAQLHEQIQLHCVNVGKSAVVVAQFLVHSLHELEHAFLGGLALGKLQEIGVDFRRACFLKGLQCHVELLDGIFPGASAEKNIKILSIPDKGVVLRLLSLSCHGVGQVFTDDQIKEKVSGNIDLVEGIDERCQLKTLPLEFHHRGCDKDFDVLHSGAPHEFLFDLSSVYQNQYLGTMDKYILFQAAFFCSILDSKFNAFLSLGSICRIRLQIYDASE